ncbi:Ig-like domain-containing protein, partial [Halomonas huangheensis]
ATLTITITGQSDAPPVVTPEDADGTASDADNSVTEGSGETVTGTLTVSAEAGIAAVSVGGVDVTSASADNPIAIATTERGSLTVTDYDAATGVIRYSYTEDSDAEDHTDDAAQVDSFDVTVTDVAGESTSGTLTVETLDTEPTAVDDKTLTTDQHTPLVIDAADVLANDTQGADGAAVTGVSLANGTHGSVTLDGDGNIVFTPTDDFEGTATIDYNITDGDGDTSSASFQVDVTDPDKPEVPVDPELVMLDEDGIEHGGVVVGNAGGNGDVAGEAATFEGRLDLDFGPDGEGYLQWDLDSFPTDLTSQGSKVAFSFSGTAGLGEMMIVEGRNEQGELVLDFVLERSTDPDDPRPHYTISIWQGLDHPDTTDSIEDNIEFNIGYVVADGNGDEAKGAIKVHVNDDSPIAMDDDGGSVEQYSQYGHAFNVLQNDRAGGDSHEDTSDTAQEFYGGELVSARLVMLGDEVIGQDDASQAEAAARAGTIELVGEDVIFHPNETFEGKVVIEYTMKDTDGDTDTALLTFNVTDPEQPSTSETDPDINPDTLHLDEDALPGGLEGGPDDIGAAAGSSFSSNMVYRFGGDGEGSFTWLLKDLPALTSGGEDVEFSVSADGLTLTGSAAGETVLTLELTNVSTGDYTVTLHKPLDHPVADSEDNLYIGARYEISDVDGDTAEGVLNIHINDDSPVAADDTPMEDVPEDGTFRYDVVANDSQGADGATLASAKLRNPALGDVDVDPETGEVIFRAARGVEGTVEIDYTITDGDGDTSTALLTLNVADDSTPLIPALTGTDGEVDEAGLSTGSRAGDGSNITTGAFTIDTGADALASLTVAGMEVLNGGSITTDLGTLTIEPGDESGVFTWRYELTSNSLEHSTQGANIDDVFESFAVVARDDDGSEFTDSLDIAIRDDTPVTYSPDSDLMVPISEQLIHTLRADWVNIKGTGTSNDSIDESSSSTLISLYWGGAGYRFKYADGLYSGAAVPTDSLFSLGTFTHDNKVVTGGRNTLDKVDLKVDFTVSIDGVDTRISTTVKLDHTETSNTGTAAQNRDIIQITNPTTTQRITVGDREFILKIEGFLDNGNLVNTIRTYEDQVNHYLLYARISSTDDLPLLEGTVIDDIIAYGADEPDIEDSLGWVGANADGVVSGQYGELTTNSDGSYSYSISREARDGMDVGDVLTETFTYYIADQDGDRVEQTLEININGLPNGDIAFSDRGFDYYNTYSDVAAPDFADLPVIAGTAENDTLEGTADAEAISGGSGGDDTLDGKGGDDVLNGGAGRDLLIGGQGSDELIGDTLNSNEVFADTFAWQLGDAGSSDAPVEDRILNFDVGNFDAGEGDRLSLGDLLEGYDAQNDTDQTALDGYIHAEQAGSSTTLYIKSDGDLAKDNSNADQKIKLENVSMGGQNSHDFLSQMIDQGQLDIE